MVLPTEKASEFVYHTPNPQSAQSPTVVYQTPKTALVVGAIVHLPMVCFVMVHSIVALLVHPVVIQMDRLLMVMNVHVGQAIAMHTLDCSANRPTTNAASFQSATPLMEQWSIPPIVRVGPMIARFPMVFSVN